MDEKTIYGEGYLCSVCGNWNRTSALCHHDKLIADNMTQLPTAEEFLLSKKYVGYPGEVLKTLAPSLIVEYAKLHVQAALESAAEKLPYDDKLNQDMMLKQSILNAYPLDNIK